MNSNFTRPNQPNVSQQMNQQQNTNMGIGFATPVPCSVMPQIYTHISPYAFSNGIPNAIYPSTMIVPNHPISYYPVRNMGNPVNMRNMGNSANANANMGNMNNFRMRPQMDSNRFSQSKNKDNSENNQAFLDIFKNVEKKPRSSISEHSDKFKQKVADSSSVSRRTSVSSHGVVNGTTINSKTQTDNESNLLFTKLFQDIPKNKDKYKHNLKDDNKSDKTNKKDLPLKTSDINEKEQPKLNDNLLKQQKSVKTDNAANEEFAAFLKNAVNAEPAPIVTCEYGCEIEGIKVYTIEEMLKIKSKMTYDIQKMVQTLSKFRIATKSQIVAVKSENAWRSVAELKELGILTDDILFNRNILKILNKLTALNFHNNCDSVKGLKIANEENIRVLSKLLYEKAIVEHSLCYVYASFAMFILKHLKEAYESEGYEKLFLKSLDDLIVKGLMRNEVIEKEILDLKESKSTDIDVIEQIIRDTAEKENKYRKLLFGAILFVVELYYLDHYSQSQLDEIFKKLDKDKDPLGLDLSCFYLRNVAHRYILKPELKSLLEEKIDELDEIVKKIFLPTQTRFPIMDLVKVKEDKFKTLLPRKIIPSRQKSKLIRAENVVKFSNQENTTRTKSSLSGHLSRSKNTGSRNNFNDTRRPDLNALNCNVRGKSSQRGARGGVVGRELLNMDRLNSFKDVNLDQEDVNYTTNTNIRKGESTKRISIQQRQKLDVTVVSTSDIPNNITNDETNVSKIQPGARKYFSVDNSDKLENKFEEMSMESARESIDISEPRVDEEFGNLMENAQTLISNFHKKDANVSMFVIELMSHKLSDHMELFLKEAFKYYSNVSDGHYSWGVLLSEIMKRYRDLCEFIISLIKGQLDELSSNAIDEPVLWDYFFLFIYPILSSKCMTLDELCDILSKVEEVYNADQVIINLLQFAEKKFAIYDNAILMIKQLDTQFWNRIKDNVEIQNIKLKMDKIVDYNGLKLNWVNIFLDLNFENKYVFDCCGKFYDNNNLALKDLATSIFLGANYGDKFTNDLIPIFTKRNVEFMNTLFGEKSSQKLLKSIVDVFIKFHYIPHGYFNIFKLNL